MPKFREVPLGEDGWPIKMPIPLPQHWCAHHMVNRGRGCLVGWGRYVFSGGKNPDLQESAEKGTPRWMFITRVMRILELKKNNAYSFDHAWEQKLINGEKVTAAWEKAAAEFGYTEDV